MSKKRRRARFLRRYNPDPEDITEEETRLLELQDQAEELAREGMGSPNIAKQLGIGEGQVRRWIQHIIDERKEELEQLRLQEEKLYPKVMELARGGMGEIAIAKQLGIAKHRVRKLIQPIIDKRAEEREQLKLRAIELYKKIGNAAEVGRELGVHKDAVARWTKHLLRLSLEEWKQLKLLAIELYKESRSPTKVVKLLKEGWLKRHLRGRIPPKLSVTHILRWTEHLRSSPTSEEREHSKSLKSQAIKLYKEIRSAEEVARRLKIEPRRVARWTQHLRSRPSREEWEKRRLRAIKLYKKIGNAAEVARRLGEKVVTVSQWTRKEGLPSKESRLQKRLLAMELYDLALGNSEEVGRIVGVSASTVTRWFKSLRRNPDPEDITEEETRLLELQDQAEGLAEQGMSAKDISKELGTPYHVARNWIQHIIDKRKKEKEKKRLQVIEMYDPALGNSAEVAKALEVARSLVIAWTKHLRAPPTPEEEKERNRLRAIELYTELKSSVKVSEILVAEGVRGVSKPVILRWTKHLRDPKYKEEQEKKRLRAIELYKEIGNCKRVGEIVGASKGAVRRWTEHLRIPDKEEMKEKKLQAIELYKKFGVASTVAEILGVSAGSVENWVKDIRSSYGKKGGWVMEDMEKKRLEAIELYPKFKSTYKVAEILGVDPKTVHRYVKHLIDEASAIKEKKRLLAIHLYDPVLRNTSVISEIIGISNAVINKWTRRARFLRRYNPDPEDISEEDIRMLELQDQAEEMAREGIGAKVIEKQLGIPEMTVRGWTQHIIDRRKATLAQAQQLARELYQGNSEQVRRQLAEEGFKFSKTAVQTWVKDLPSTLQQKLAQAKKLAKELYQESGNSEQVRRQLAEEGFKFSKAAVYLWVKDLPSTPQQKLAQAKKLAKELYQESGNAAKVLKQLTGEGFKISKWQVYSWLQDLMDEAGAIKEKKRLLAIHLYDPLIRNTSVISEIIGISNAVINDWIRLDLRAQSAEISL